MTKLLHIYTAEGVKSIPLNAWPKDAFTSLMGEGSQGGVMTYYRSVPWLYRGTNVRANSIAYLPRCWEDGDKEKEDYRPPFQLNLNRLLNEIAADRTLFGAAYIWKDAGVPLRMRKIRRLLPSTITPITDKDSGLKGFKRSIGGTVKEFTTDEIAYSWLPNRESEMGPGMPPGQAAMRAGGVLRNLDELVEKFFEQGAIAPVIIGIDDSAQETDLERIKSWFDRRVAGVKNAFGAIAVRGGINPHTLMQDDLRKLAMSDLNNQKREDIATALGVPHSLLFSNAANYATANQDILNWYELTIIPEAGEIEEGLNEQLFEPLLGLSMKFKPQRLEVFQAREMEKALGLTALFDRQIVDKNEVREQAGFDPDEADAIIAEAPTDPNQPTAQSTNSRPPSEIFGYHIELGVVSRNEARVSLGLEPIEESEDEQKLRSLQILLAALQSAVNTGIPLENAIPLVGLDALLPPDQIKRPEPVVPTLSAEDDPDPSLDYLADLKRWKAKALKYLKADKPLSFAFRSEAIGEALAGAIEGALESCRTAADVARVFDDAKHWEASHG